MKQTETLFWHISACSVTGATARMRESELFFFFISHSLAKKLPFQDRQLIKTLINLFAADTPT